MKHIYFALLVTALGSVALLAFASWLGMKPITAIGGAALFAIANMAAAMALIRRAAAQNKGE